MDIPDDRRARASPAADRRDSDRVTVIINRKTRRASLRRLRQSDRPEPGVLAPATKTNRRRRRQHQGLRSRRREPVRPCSTFLPRQQEPSEPRVLRRSRQLTELRDRRRVPMRQVLNRKPRRRPSRPTTLGSLDSHLSAAALADTKHPAPRLRDPRPARACVLSLGGVYGVVSYNGRAARLASTPSAWPWEPIASSDHAARARPRRTNSPRFGVGASVLVVADRHSPCRCRASSTASARSTSPPLRGRPP